MTIRRFSYFIRISVFVVTFGTDLLNALDSLERQALEKSLGTTLLVEASRFHASNIVITGYIVS